MIKNIIYLISLILILSSCRKLVKDEFKDPVLDSGNDIVLNGIITPNDSILINLSKLANVSATEFVTFSDLEVQLYENEQLVESVSDGEDGTYQFDFKPQPMNSYRVSISETSPEIFASTTIPQAYDNYKVAALPNYNIDDEGFYYAGVEVTLLEEMPEDAFFEVLIRKEVNNGYFDTINRVYVDMIEYPIMNLQYPLTDPLFLAEGLDIPIFQSNNVPYYPYKIYIPYETGKEDTLESSYSPFLLEIRAISKDYYEYRKSLELYKKTSNISVVDEVEALNLYSNVNNAVGVFISYSSTISDTIRF